MMKEFHQVLVLFCYYTNYITELEQSKDQNAWRKYMSIVMIPLL